MMFWKSGWLVDSLRYRVEKSIRETLYQNEDFLNNRWSLIERLFILGAKHIFIANLVLASIALFIYVLVSTQYDFLKQYIPISLSGLASIPKFQLTIFVAQITLLGLIFPLVIAFIGVLLQGKSSNESMWMVYRHNSGFMLVGFSALILSVVFVFFKLIEPWLAHPETVAASISITSWFVINLFLSGKFLWKTIQFLSLDERMEMVVKYAINEVIVDDIRKRLLFWVHHNAVTSKTGLLLEPKDGKFEITNFLVNDSRSQVSREFSEPKSINNVWYRLLNIGIWCWSIQGSLSQSRNNNTAILCLPFSVDGHRRKSMVLAEVQSNRINFLSAIFIRNAVRTTAKFKSTSLDIEQMIGALFGQIEDALKDNNSRLFDSAKNNLVQFHREIESSMCFNDEGKSDNWLLLPERPWFGKNLLDVFIREYTGIAKKVIRRVRDDASYYETWCYLYTRLFRTQDMNTPAKVAEAYINGHYLIWGELMSWMGGFSSDDLIADHQKDSAIKYFIGSWESWDRLVNTNFISVNEMGFHCAIRHLENTSCMLVHATKYENFDAARWATDVLVYWYELFSNNHRAYNYYGWHHELLTPPLLKFCDDHPLRLAVSSNNDFIESEASSIALRNYWTDIRCLTAAYLMGTQKYNISENYKEYIDALLICKRLEPTGNVGINYALLSSAEDILGVYLRQSDRWGDERTYTDIIEQHLHRLASIEESKWVSGRIYSSSGTKKDVYLPIFYKVVGIGLTRNKFKLDAKWMHFLKSDSVLHRELKSTISELRKLTLIDDTIINLVCRQFNIENNEAESRRDLFIESINDIVADLEENIASEIINAPLDRQRLKKFGVSASRRTFTLSEGPIPISLFQKIEHIDNLESGLIRQNIANYQKSEISQGLDVNRVVNEDEWLNNIVKQLATIDVFQQLFNHRYWKEKEFEDTLTLISSAVKDGESINKAGLTPIMFVGQWNLYHRINASQRQYAQEEDKLPFDISVESGRSTSYVCHLAGIEIYRLPFERHNFSIMLPMEAFKKISIKRFGDERYVDVNFTTKSNTDLTGTLSLSFGIECEFQATEFFKYISKNPDEE